MRDQPSIVVMKGKIVKISGIFSPGREFKRQLEQRWQKLYRLAFAWTQDAHLAADLAQDTAAKALKNWRQLKDMQSMNAWLFRILANCWRDHGRKKRDLIDIDEIEIEGDSDPERASSRFELIKKVRTAMAKLSPEQNQIVTLIDLEECSYGDVAAILDIPIGTVMSRLCRARRNLLGHLQNADTGNNSDMSNIFRIKK